MAAARALYRPAPAAQELAAFGLQAADIAEPPVEVYPCTLAALDLMAALGTQWRVGQGGVTGLDYAAAESALRLQRTPRSQWPQLFADLRVMERAALQEMRREH